MGLLDLISKVKDPAIKAGKKALNTKLIQAGTGLDNIQQQIANDAIHLAVNGNKKMGRRAFLDLVGNRGMRTTGRVAGEIGQTIPAKAADKISDVVGGIKNTYPGAFNYMVKIIKF